MIGRLKPVDFREIWPKEASHFTKWLFENIDILNEQLGLELTPIETEKEVGPFNADIMAEDSEGRIVIIENQLEKTDHDHLGKVLTYLSNLNAKIAIWISPDPRPEHVTAINYLNEIVPYDTQFYLVRIQVFRISDSEPAPLFTIEAGPSEERRASGAMKKEMAEKDKKRLTFFKELLLKCNKRTKLFNNVSPVGYQSWLTTGAGKSGLNWQIVIMKHSARVELFFCDQNAEANKTRFLILKDKAEDIENNFGYPLTWDLREERKQQYIRTSIEIGGLDDENKWDQIQDEMINRLVKFEKAITPHIKLL